MITRYPCTAAPSSIQVFFPNALWASYTELKITGDSASAEKTTSCFAIGNLRGPIVNTLQNPFFGTEEVQAISFSVQGARLAKPDGDSGMANPPCNACVLFLLAWWPILESTLGCSEALLHPVPSREWWETCRPAGWKGMGLWRQPTGADRSAPPKSL